MKRGQRGSATIVQTPFTALSSPQLCLPQVSTVSAFLCPAWLGCTQYPKVIARAAWHVSTLDPEKYP